MKTTLGSLATKKELELSWIEGWDACVQAMIYSVKDKHKIRKDYLEKAKPTETL